jgi:hypothetical protein
MFATSQRGERLNQRYVASKYRDPSLLFLRRNDFWFGGRAISEFAKTERVFAEMEGIALTAIFGGLGAIIKTAAGCVEEDEGDISLSESLRK